MKFYCEDNTLNIISVCDVFVCSDKLKTIIGFFYENEENEGWESPVAMLVCKDDFEFNTYKALCMENTEIQENTPLVKSLLNEIEKKNYAFGDNIPEKYYLPLAEIYRNKTKVLIPEEHFKNKLLKKINYRFQQNFIENFKIEYEKISSEKALVSNLNEIQLLFSKEFSNIAKEQNLSFVGKNDSMELINNTDNSTDSFYKNLRINFYSDICCISVVHPFFVGEFSSLEYQSLIEFIKRFYTGWLTFKKKYDKYRREFQISFEEYKIFFKEVSEINEKYLDSKDVEYSWTEDKCVLEYSIKMDSQKYWLIVITIKEFLRNKEAFIEFIQRPRKKHKWNFWCKIVEN